MNPRIRELSEQAEKYADDNFRGEPTWSEAFESKFAELIVRECAGVELYWLGEQDRKSIAEKITQHFGVDHEH